MHAAPVTIWSFAWVVLSVAVVEENLGRDRKLREKLGLAWL